MAARRPARAAVPPARLARALGPRDLIAIVVGSVIGSGIFLVPGTVLRQVGGRVGLALGVWLAAGLLSLLGALTYGELGAMRPEAGGLYAYIRDAFGPLPAFLYGWTSFFVISSGTVATLAVASTTYLQELRPMSAAAARVLAILLIGALAAVNVRGVRDGARVQDWATLLKAGALVALSVLLLTHRGAAPAAAADTGGGTPPSLLAGVGLAMVGTLWAYEGWQYVTFSAGETRDPQRVFPRGLVVGTATLVALYLLANVAYLAALGPAAVARSDRVAAEAATAVLGPAAGRAVAVVIVVSMFSAANGVVLTTPRAFYAMARDGVFFRRLADVHPRYGTPAVAIGASALWAMVLTATGTFEQLLTYVVFVGWIFYGLGAASVFVFRRREPDAPRPYRVPGYPATPALFVLAAAAVVASTVVAQPGRAAVGLAAVALGVPAFLGWRRRTPSR